MRVTRDYANRNPNLFSVGRGIRESTGFGAYLPGRISSNLMVMGPTMSGIRSDRNQLATWIRISKVELI